MKKSLPLKAWELRKHSVNSPLKCVENEKKKNIIKTNYHNILFKMVFFTGIEFIEINTPSHSEICRRIENFNLRYLKVLTNNNNLC